MLLVTRLINKIKREKIQKQIKYVGKGTNISPDLKIINGKNIFLGEDCQIGPNCRIEAWTTYNNKIYHPVIKLGNDVRINSRCHIGAINKVIIKDDCLIGSNVMIIDHAHGNNSWKEMKIHPGDRDLYSKGPVIIGEKTWLCENVVILPNVHIGKGCIIGASAVVTKDIPDYSVVAGNPAKIVKKINE